MAEQEPTAEQLVQSVAENEKDEHWVTYKPAAQKSIQEIQEQDKIDENLCKNKEALWGCVALSADPAIPKVVVTCLTLVCSLALGPLDLDLENFQEAVLCVEVGHGMPDKNLFPNQPGDYVQHEVHPAHVERRHQD